MTMGVDLPGDDATRPRDLDRLTRFYGWAATHLRSTLADAGPHATALTLLGPGPAVFWRRRQLHETLVHLVDLRLAAGTGPSRAVADVAPHVWADTVDEVVTMFRPRQSKGAPLGRPVGLVAEDAGETAWTLGIGGARRDARPADAVDRRPQQEHAVVRAPAWVLALLLWHRVTLDLAADLGLVVEGDETAVAQALSAPLVP
jgi:hypothetical protein